MGTSTFSVTGGLAAQYIERGEMIPWEGALVVEGTDTGDRRSIAAGALSHRDLPLPFMVQMTNPVNGDGHDGATLFGRIDELTKRDDGVWWGKGFIDPTTADGEAAALALDKKLMRGVSVDLDQVEIDDVAGEYGNHQVIRKARIIGATACPFAAFAESEIHFAVGEMTEALAASSGDFDEWQAELDGGYAAVWSPVDGVETLIASAGHAIPVDPPLEWFARPSFTELTPFTILPNGRVFGHIAAKGTCHISFASKCVPVPTSNTNYAAFRCGSVLTAEGTPVRTGPIVMDTVHPDLRWQASDAMAFYADTGSAMADVVPYDDDFGLAVVGAMRPNATAAQMRALRGSDFSPDWRTINGTPREMCALLAVNNSGFKLPQALAASAGAYIEPGDTAIALDSHDDVYALVASGPMSLEPCCDECAGHDHDEAVVAARRADVVGGLERDERIAALRARFAPPERKSYSFRMARFATFDESEHPRANDGKFGDPGTGPKAKPPASKAAKGAKAASHATKLGDSGKGEPSAAAISACASHGGSMVSSGGNNWSCEAAAPRQGATLAAKDAPKVAPNGARLASYSNKGGGVAVYADGAVLDGKGWWPGGGKPGSSGGGSSGKSAKSGGGGKSGGSKAAPKPHETPTYKRTNPQGADVSDDDKAKAAPPKRRFKAAKATNPVAKVARKFSVARAEFDSEASRKAWDTRGRSNGDGGGGGGNQPKVAKADRKPGHTGPRKPTQLYTHDVIELPGGGTGKVLKLTRVAPKRLRVETDNYAKHGVFEIGDDEKVKVIKSDVVDPFGFRNPIRYEGEESIAEAYENDPTQFDMPPKPKKKHPAKR